MLNTPENKMCPECCQPQVRQLGLVNAIDNAEVELQEATLGLEYIGRSLSHETNAAERRHIAEQLRSPAENIVRLLKILDPLWRQRDGN